MGLPINIDEYSRYIVMNDDELIELKINPILLDRLHRLRALYAHWLQFPSKSENEIVSYNIAYFNVKKSQAYDDLRLVQLLLGNIQQASKEFMRWKINKDLEEDLKAARRAKDYRSVAALQKNRILNNRTDKEDEIEIEYDKIVPQNFMPTEDPTVIGITKIPGLREKIRAMTKKYAADVNWRETEYEEVEDDEPAGE